jgi:ADP-heptose:LPS heptosyltransferase
LIDYGEIPGGKNELRSLLYPYYKIYPFKLWSKYRWLKNSHLNQKLPHLNQQNRWVTVIDRLGAPGDALITANVIRGIKHNYPKIKINCISPNSVLIRLDPQIDAINKKETFYSFDSSYWELIARKEKNKNVVAFNLERLGIFSSEYKSKFYLSTKEKEWAKSMVHNIKKPIVAFCSRSKESVKNWPIEHWKKLLKQIGLNCSLLHIGDQHEPVFEGITRYAGKLTMRESAAVLSRCTLFIGPDSLLMHIANGLDIKSVIIFGGSRPVSCFGYTENTNITKNPDCSPCWIHDGYEKCYNNIQCLSSISHLKVLDLVRTSLNN